MTLESIINTNLCIVCCCSVKNSYMLCQSRLWMRFVERLHDFRWPDGENYLFKKLEEEENLKVAQSLSSFVLGQYTIQKHTDDSI